MASYQLWGHWNALDESFAWIREKVPSGQAAGERRAPLPGAPGQGKASSPTPPPPTVYRRVLGRSAKARGVPTAGTKTFNPVIGHPIRLPDLASNRRKDDLARVLQTLQLIRSRSGQGLAQGGHDHLSYAPLAE